MEGGDGGWARCCRWQGGWGWGHGALFARAPTFWHNTATQNATPNTHQTPPHKTPSHQKHSTPKRYGRSERLRSLVNLVVVGGVLDPSHTGDREEAAECEKMHRLIDEHGLRVRAMGCDLGIGGLKSQQERAGNAGEGKGRRRAPARGSEEGHQHQRRQTHDRALNKRHQHSTLDTFNNIQQPQRAASAGSSRRRTASRTASSTASSPTAAARSCRLVALG